MDIWQGDPALLRGCVCDRSPFRAFQVVEIGGDLFNAHHKGARLFRISGTLLISHLPFPGQSVSNKIRLPPVLWPPGIIFIEARNNSSAITLTKTI